jgi:multidrug efflux pump subunit AcrA (membrane-fusion protein)
VNAGIITALGAAIVGVVGTLLSALLTQRASDRSRLAELDRAEAARSQERQQEQARTDLEKRRGDYARLNTAARQYLMAQTDHMHALRQGNDPSPTSAALDAARRAYQACYSEAQLRVPNSVLSAASKVNESHHTVQMRINDHWDQIRTLRDHMRADLGITE